MRVVLKPKEGRVVGVLLEKLRGGGAGGFGIAVGKIGAEVQNVLLSDGGREARDEMIEGAVVTYPAFGRSILDEAGAELEEQDGERKKKKGEGNAHPLFWDGCVGIEANAKEKKSHGARKNQNEGQSFNKRQSLSVCGGENGEFRCGRDLFDVSLDGDGARIPCTESSQKMELKEHLTRVGKILEGL